jgi:hypothetical protein
MAEHQMYTKEMGPTLWLNTRCTRKKWDLLLSMLGEKIVLSTSLAVSKVRSEDCIPSLIYSTYLSLFAVSHLIFVF